MKVDQAHDGDEKHRLEWWQSIPEFERVRWLHAAGSSEPIDAWVEYKRQLGEDGVTDERLRRRQAAVNSARASVGLEGFQLSAEVEAIAERFITGEIDIGEFGASIVELARLEPPSQC